MIIDNWNIPGVLYTRYTGTVTGGQLIASSLIATGDERFDNLNYIIGDWSQVEFTQVGPEHVKELIACLGPASRNCPKATNTAIVKRNNTGTALAAWYRHVGESLPWQIDIHMDTREAFIAYGLDFTQLADD